MPIRQPHIESTSPEDNARARRRAVTSRASPAALSRSLWDSGQVRVGIAARNIAVAEEQAQTS
jgi:hypothetical protein